MKNTFKKALLATSIAAAAGMSQAATLAITGVNVSQEGAAGAASVAVPNAVVTLGAEYTVNDTVTFTLSGAEFDTTLSAPALAYADASGGDGSGTMTLGLLNTTTTSVTFRITDLVPNTGDAVTTADTITLSGMVMKTSTVLDATGDITATYSALTNNNQTLDGTGTLTDVVSTVVAQFTSSATKELNGIIDVENARQQFTAADEGTTDDELVITIAEAAADAATDADYTGAVHTISGDFSWMDTDGDGAVGGDLTTGELQAALAVTTGNDDTFTGAINAAMDTITITATDGGANDVEAHTLTFTVAGLGDDSAILDAQDFTVSTTVNYNTAAPAAATKVTATDADAGSWTLNGSVVKVPYLVVSNGRFGLIANVSNSGTKTGAIVLDVYGEDGTELATNYAAGTSTPGSIVSVAAPLRAALEAAGKDLSATTKFSFVITTNVPANDVLVYAAYTDGTTSERAVVNSDMKVQTK